MPTFPRAELDARIRRLQERMGCHQPPLDALLAVGSANLYYLAGTVQTSHLLVPREGAPRLLVRKVLERAREDSALETVLPLESLRGLPDEVRGACGPPPWRIGMELDVLPVAAWRRYADLLGESTEIIDASRLLLECRAVKSELEIEELRKAAALHEELFRALPDLLARDVSSYELQSLLEHRARTLGHCGVIRMRGLDASTGIGIVVSGEEGAIPSHSLFPIGGAGPHPWVAHGGSFRRIEDDTPVIADFLMSITGYHADCTRMAVRGTFPDEAMRIFEALRGILRFAEREARVGAVPSAIYAGAVELAADSGLADNFMGPGDLAVRFVGHGVGLEVNEVPVLAPRFDMPLVAGNTLAIEPKYTHPHWGVIGIENTYVVREHGLERLTAVAEEVIVARR